MDHTNSSSNPPSSRVTLKLKTAVRKSPREPETAAPPIPQPHKANKHKPGAHWSDEFKERMQAEMDALAR